MENTTIKKHPVRFVRCHRCGEHYTDDPWFEHKCTGKYWRSWTHRFKPMEMTPTVLTGEDLREFAESLYNREFQMEYGLTAFYEEMRTLYGV